MATMPAILDLRSEQSELFFIDKPPKEKFKIDFQDGGRGDFQLFSTLHCSWCVSEYKSVLLLFND